MEFDHRMDVSAQSGPSRASLAGAGAPAASEPLAPTRNILGVGIAAASREDALAFLLARLASRQSTAVAFANANLLVHASTDPALKHALEGMLVLNDGVAVDAASRVLYGHAFPDNLNGTDFTPKLLAALPAGTRIFLYGARPPVVAGLAGRIAAERRLDVCGWRDGFAPALDLVENINAAKADVVLVALGNPLQELWIAKARHSVAAPLLLGVGAYFDFATGNVPRAPAFMRALRLEWLFRLTLEPGRLWKRYTVDTARFFIAVLKQAAARRG